MLAFIDLVAAFNGALVAIVLLGLAFKTRLRASFLLAAFLLLGAIQLAAFVALDQLWIRYAPWIGIVLDLMALMTAALMLDYVRTSVSAQPSRYFIYATALLYAAACLVNGGRIGAPGDFRLIVAVQTIYSALAVAAYVRARAARPAGWAKRADNRHLPVLLVGLALLHIGQLLRMAAPHNSLIFELAPLVGAAGLIAFSVYALIGSQILRSLAAPARVSEADDAIGERLSQLVATKRAFADPDFTLAKAAELVGVTPTRLSAYLNDWQGQSFRAYLNGLRIEEAKRMLKDPAEARTSVDAIGQLVGFRSRSSFYTAFQNVVGMAPNAYRTTNAIADVRIPDSGQTGV